MKKLIVVVLILFIVSILIQYVNEDEKVVQVIKLTTQQQINQGEEGISSSYKYLVTTDKGIFEITPSGLFSCPEFGSLVEGKTYLIHTRGHSYPVIGIFPYIIRIENDSREN